MSSESRSGDGVELSQLLVTVGRDRDVAAFRSLFDLLAPRIRAYLSRRSDQSGVIEDVMQEAFVNIWKKAHLYDPGKASAATWIYAVARNAKIDLVRKHSRPGVDVNDPAFVPDPVPTPHQNAARTQEQALLARALEQLPGEQEQILRLAFFAEKSHAEIAQDLGLPLGTVKSRIRLALERLRRELGEGRS